ncbi:hypothetical protein [Methylohalobius crimeensis]|uniref:hypothetical protein n=1 Tax=Methylohalobius crimeensis TaxID=244365 RepID=UPI0003B4F8D5|nr:hypothetical protein [Methylohalobius crimeensis]
MNAIRRVNYPSALAVHPRTRPSGRKPDPVRAVQSVPSSGRKSFAEPAVEDSIRARRILVEDTLDLRTRRALLAYLNAQSLPDETAPQLWYAVDAYV